MMSKNEADNDTVELALSIIYLVSVSQLHLCCFGIYILVLNYMVHSKINIDL